MKTNIIKDLLEWLDSEYEEEVAIASEDFFKNINRDKLKAHEIDTVDTMFNEWLLYEYEMFEPNYTPLEYIVIENPWRLTERELNNYRELIENIYSLFEINEVRLNKGLKITDLYTNKQYNVKEKMMTLQVKKGMAFFGRIAKIGSKYELVGANSMPAPRPGKILKENLLEESSEEITLKNISELLYSHKTKEETSKI